MMFVCTWLWGTKWSMRYVDKLFASVNRNLEIGHWNVLISDDEPTSTFTDIHLIVSDPLMDRLGCLPRMRMFSELLQNSMEAHPGDRVVVMDVDSVITGPLDDLLNGDEEFRIMQGFNSTNPCPFNGSLWSFNAGERHDVWDDFSWEAVQKIPKHAIPDDQGWLHHKFPDAAAYGPQDGVYAFKKRTWETGKDLPANARYVAFPGRDPAKFSELDWIRANWRADLT